MKIVETKIEGLLIIEPQVYADERGYFFEAFNGQRWADAGLNYNWVQDNESKSGRGVLRGLHFQRGAAAQAKLVRVTAGSVQDVAVDLRPGSPTYGEHVTVQLSAENKRQLLIPRGFAHGFLCLEDDVIFTYKCDNYYNREADGGIYFADECLAIDWILPASELIISEKDQHLPRLGDLETLTFQDC